MVDVMYTYIKILNLLIILISICLIFIPDLDISFYIILPIDIITMTIFLVTMMCLKSESMPLLVPIYYIVLGLLHILISSIYLFLTDKILCYIILSLIGVLEDVCGVLCLVSCIINKSNNNYISNDNPNDKLPIQVESG